jgi:hypothetical protein
MRCSERFAVAVLLSITRTTSFRMLLRTITCSQHYKFIFDNCYLHITTTAVPLLTQQVVQLLTAHAATELEPLVRDLMAQHSTCQLSLQHMLEVCNSH